MVIKKLVHLTVALLFVMSFTACSSDDGGKRNDIPSADQQNTNQANPNQDNTKPAEPAKSANEEAPQTSNDPVTLKLAMNAWLAEGEYEAYFENPVKEHYPHITLEFINLSEPETNLEQLVITGNIPDIVQSANPIIYTFTDTGMADSIEPLITKHQFDLSALNAVAVESVKTATGNDDLIGLPWTMHFNATYYNKDIFDQFGVDYPHDGMTWEEARSKATQLTRFENEVQYRGLEPDVPSRIVSIFNRGFIDVEMDQATFNTDEWKNVFAFLKRVYEIPGNEEFRWVPASNNQFMIDQTLAMLTSINLLPNFKDVEGLNWDMAQFPQFPELPNTGMQVDEWILHVTKQSEHKDAAFQVIATVLSEEVQLEIARNARFPVMSSEQIQTEFGSNMPHLEGKNLQAAFLTDPAPALPASALAAQGQAISQEAFFRVMRDGQDINSALAQANEELNQKIAEVLAQ